jgi:hypothetical protein
MKKRGNKSVFMNDELLGIGKSCTPSVVKEVENNAMAVIQSEAMAEAIKAENPEVIPMKYSPCVFPETLAIIDKKIRTAKTLDAAVNHQKTESEAGKVENMTTQQWFERYWC